MTPLAARYQRVFNSVFPSEESPFVNGSGISEEQGPNHTQVWDILARILKPNFSPHFDESELLEGNAKECARLTCSLAYER